MIEKLIQLQSVVRQLAAENEQEARTPMMDNEGASFHEGKAYAYNWVVEQIEKIVGDKNDD